LQDENRLQIRSEHDILSARRRGRELAGELGFSASELTIVATAISEIARNIVEYAGQGEIAFAVVRDGQGQGIVVVARDEGPGISDVAQAMQDGYSSGRSLGLGLPGARRLMDEFEVTSEVGKGTTVTMKKWMRSTSARVG
jgi:serine/threonine-protein kinase RsbT